MQLNKDEVNEKKTKTLIINNNYNTEIIIPTDTRNILMPQKNMFIKNYLNNDSFSIEDINNNKREKELENYKQEKIKIKEKMNEKSFPMDTNLCIGKNSLKINRKIIPDDNLLENKKINIGKNIPEYEKQKEIIPSNNLLENKKKINVKDNISEYEKQKEIFLKNIMDSGERLSRINRKEISPQFGIVKNITQLNVLSETTLQNNLFKDQIKINIEDTNNLKTKEKDCNNDLGKTIIQDKTNNQINNNIVNLNNSNDEEMKIISGIQTIGKNTFVNEIENKMTDCLIIHQGKLINLLNSQLDNPSENSNKREDKSTNKKINRINESTTLIKEQNIKTNIQLFNNNDIYEYPDTKKDNLDYILNNVDKIMIIEEVIDDDKNKEKIPKSKKIFFKSIEEEDSSSLDTSYEDDEYNIFNNEFDNIYYSDDE